MGKTDGAVSRLNGSFALVSGFRPGLAGLAAFSLLAAAGPAMAQKKPLALLDQLDRGGWELRGQGEHGKLCLRTGRELIQLQHPLETCSSVVVDDTASEVTVQYTCPGHGYGRTHIRRETNALVQIDSQGIAHGRPFAFATEGRHTGDCGG